MSFPYERGLYKSGGGKDLCFVKRREDTLQSGSIMDCFLPQT